MVCPSHKIILYFFLTAFNDSNKLFEYDVNNVRCVAVSDLGSFQEENQSTVS
jgi:hypothetical protein